ncbi:hypothetical protein DX933_15675 [Ornithinibacillus gellani]|uniref:C39 family peptidase n=1 Tax=Ornithinibacillus gellani TaxID=2293253 RepID=UPI000F48C0FD|nr:C39 family peptidase [Ornithinibacillus gellani]TQS71121.1 hypothetical protein DX933_15675 [Ornithinibacillus gellani]
MFNKKFYSMIFAFLLTFSLLMTDVSAELDGNSQNYESFNHTGVLDDVSISEEEIIKSELEEKERDKEIELFFNESEKIPSFSYTNSSELKEAVEFLGVSIPVDPKEINQIPDGQWYSVYMASRKQINGYYCGPAAVQQNLSFHKNSTTGLPSQDTLAKLAGTTKAGSSSYGLRDALNKYTSTYKFTKYVVGNVTTSQQTTWENRIKSNLINARRAPIILLQTRHLPRYKNKDIRHYNSVRSWSYDYTNNVKKVRNVDPHYSNIYYGQHWDPVGSSKTKGAFLATAKAYRSGGNPNMIY